VGSGIGKREVLDLAERIMRRGRGDHGVGNPSAGSSGPTRPLPSVPSPRVLPDGFAREAGGCNVAYHSFVLGVALGGCGGPQPPKSTRLTFEVIVL